MGFNDRHYLRRESPAAGAARRAGLMPSANTWLIIICVAVYVIDGFLPLRWVPTGKMIVPPELRNIDPARLKITDREERSEVPFINAAGREHVQTIVQRQVIDKENGQIVGVAETRPMRFLESWLYFSTKRLVTGIEYWRLIGFQFLHDHSSMAHLILNMMGLYFFGPFVQERLGGKRYLAFYLLCGIFGAMMYLLLNVLGIVTTSLFGEGLRIPFLLFNDTDTPLIGASAGVFGVLMAGAYLNPNAIVLIFFVLPMRFATLAYLLIGISLVSLAFQLRNAGGEAAHLGGAIAGMYFIRRQHHLHGFFNLLGRVDPTSRSNRARRGERGSPAPIATDIEVDRILAKIKSTGMGSLTDAERHALRAASGREE